jgi:hypothetical protein
LPFGACGIDPTPSLSCERFPPCSLGNCDPQDAKGVGPCDAIVGVFWDGVRCTYHSGCTCEGEDCDEGYASVEECYIAHQDCPNACDPQDARAVGDCERVLGHAWDGERCRVLVGCTCEGEDCEEGSLFASIEECEAAYPGCPRGTCEPMDVRGEGFCRVILGHHWDGLRCRALSACECIGEDCEDLYRTEDECRQAHFFCPTPCTPMNAEAVGPCLAIIGTKWDGSSCVEMSGCECIGDDCEELFPGLEECAEAMAQCR